MAYQTGTFTGSDDLLSKFRTWLVTTNGWTENDYSVDGTGYQLHVQKTIDSVVHYYSLRSCTAEQVNLYESAFTGVSSMPATGYSGVATNWFEQPGARYLSSGGDFYDGGGWVVGADVTNANYHFFSHNGSIGFAYVNSSGAFQAITLGCCGERGHICSNGNIVGTSSIVRRYASYGGGTTEKELPGMQAYVDSDFRFSFGHFSTVGAESFAFVNVPYGRTDFHPSPVIPIYDNSPDGFRGNPILTDSECFYQASSSTELVPLSPTNGVFFFNSTFYGNEDEITIGSDTYVLFKNSGTNEGIAFLK